MVKTCLDCFNKRIEAHCTRAHMVLTRVPERCEDCGEMKRAVVWIRAKYSPMRIFWALLGK